MQPKCEYCNKSLKSDHANWFCTNILCNSIYKDQSVFSNTFGDQMAEKQAQRFGKLHMSFGDFGELRKQKKAPHTEVLYIFIKNANEMKKSDRFYKDEILRSVNNSTNDQLIEAIRRTGAGLESGNLAQDKAEIILDKLYTELNKRVH